MKHVWPQKVSKIVSELLNLHASISLIDNVTRGKLSFVLSQLPNRSEYFLGSVTLSNNSGGNYILNLRRPLKDANTKTLTEVFYRLSNTCANLFFSEYLQCNIIVYKLENDEDSDTQTVAIYITCNRTSQMQKFVFNKTDTTEDEFTDAVVDHTLEMLIELLTKFPHLKYMEL